MPTQLIKEGAQVAAVCRHNQEYATTWQPMEHECPLRGLNHDLGGRANRRRFAEGVQRTQCGRRQRGHGVLIQRIGERGADHEAFVADNHRSGHVRALGDSLQDGSKWGIHDALQEGKGRREATTSAAPKSSNDRGLPHSAEGSNLLR